MKSVVIVADSGAEMARLTAVVEASVGMALVRHASGRVPVASIVAVHEPSLVLLGEMSPRRLVLERLAEIRQASPTTKVVVAANDADARWLGIALGAGATAVVPGGPSGRALGTVLQEVLTCRPILPISHVRTASDNPISATRPRSSRPPEDRAGEPNARSAIDQGRKALTCEF